MIITFSKMEFVTKILLGDKLYTIRDNNRYKVGTKLQLWYRSPRHPHLNPYHFANAVVEWIDELDMKLSDDQIKVTPLHAEKEPYMIKDMKYFADMDGFTSIEEMKSFFAEDKTRYRIWFTDVEPVN